MRKALVSIVSLAALLLVSLAASADNNSIFRVDPRHAGFGAVATWERDAGEPGQKGDPKQYGLYLQVGVTVFDGPFAGTDNLLKESIPAGSLTKLGFAISGRSGEGGVFVPGDPKHGYCQGGAPRFLVEFTGGAGSCFFECAHGTKVQDPATNWWDISFVPPFTQYPSCPGGLVGTITYMDITFDEQGSVVLDNITATIGGKTTVVGKPDEGDGDKDE